MWDGRRVIDGGMADQAPMPHPDRGRTLVLLTRALPAPAAGRRAGSTSRPSRATPADKIDFTDPAKIQRTWDQGERGRALVPAKARLRRSSTRRETGNGTCCTGYRGVARHRRRDLARTEGRGLHGRRDLWRQRRGGREAFTDETGIKTYKWSVADYDACKEGIAKVEAELGPVEVLVNNAGITRDAMFHRMTPEQWREVIDTNLNGVFNMTHPVWPGMRERKFGRVITISSINGQKGQFGPGELLGLQGGRPGHHPGAGAGGRARRHHGERHLPGLHRHRHGDAPSHEKVLNERIIPQIPVGRLGEPEEIARCVVFLASDEAGFVTGSTISANGGQYFT